MSDSDILSDEIATDRIQNSAQIALEAAEAAMDVTTEFSNIAKSFTAARKSILDLKKIFFIALIAGSSVGVLSVVLMALLMFNTIDQANTIAKTNEALLTNFAENIQKFNKDLELIGGINQNITATNEELENVKNAVFNLTEQVNKFYGGSTYQDGIDGINNNLKVSVDKIAAQNGEFANLTLERVDRRLKEQFEATSKSLQLVIATLRSSGGASKKALKKLKALQSNLRGKITRLEKDLKTEKKKVKSAATKGKRKKDDNNVIRFPPTKR